MARWIYESTLPCNYVYSAGAVILNDEIHLLNDSDGTHYKYSPNNGWTQEANYPGGAWAVVVNGEIHTLCSSNNNSSHYKYSNGEWVRVSTLPYWFDNGWIVVLNDEIHLLGGYGGSDEHYKYSNGSWVSVSTLPYQFCNGRAVVLNNEIHILGGNWISSTYKYHYKYSNGSWSSVSTLPYNFYDYGDAVVFNGNIHILSGGGGTGLHYQYVNNTWSECTELPQTFDGYFSTIIFNNEINILGCGNYHYKFTDEKFPNKVLYGNTPIIDLTSDTVTQNDVVNTAIFHQADGSRQIGMLPCSDVTPSDTNPSQVPSGSVARVNVVYGYFYQSKYVPQIICSFMLTCTTGTSYTKNSLTLSNTIDYNFFHCSDGNIIVDRYIPNAKIFGQVMLGRLNAGGAGYGRMQVRLNGTNIISLTSSSDNTSPSTTVTQTLNIGDVISVYTRTASTDSSKIRAQIRIRTQ